MVSIPASHAGDRGSIPPRSIHILSPLNELWGVGYTGFTLSVRSFVRSFVRTHSLPGCVLHIICPRLLIHGGLMHHSPKVCRETNLRPSDRHFQGQGHGLTCSSSRKILNIFPSGLYLPHSLSQGITTWWALFAMVNVTVSKRTLTVHSYFDSMRYHKHRLVSSHMEKQCK